MKTSIEQQKASVTLTIELEVKEWQEILEQAAAKISQAADIKGFRPGKAPLDAVISNIGEARVLSEASNIAAGKFYAEAAKEHKLIPVTPPKISIEKLDIKQPLIFKVEVTVMPEVEMGDYKKIKVEAQPITVDKSKAEKTLKDIQKRAVKFKEIDREAQKGDWIEIDFEGKLDGVLFEGGASKNHPLIIGDGVFLPGFEEALIGLKAKNEKTFKVTFPKDYHQKNLAGKEVEFIVKAHKIKEVELPPLDDNLAKSLGKFQSLDELKTDIDKWLKEEAEKQEQTRQREAAMEELIKITKVDIPEELIDQEVSAMVEDLTRQLSQQNMSLEDYLKRNSATEDEMRKQWKTMAEKRVIAGLALDAFKKQENVESTDTEVTEEIKRLQQIYPDQKDEIKEKYSSDIEKRRLKHLLSGQKALEHLWKIATQ